ncbi:MAG: type II secretion system protein [Planctomycetota bacterium]|jgi:prepilin-type N-terminal cleavage/methylation domain-containing protein|nr:type II secretion system protein [Planctomycetota bacterium]
MRPTSRSAFTAVEILVVLSVIAILTGVTLPSLVPAMRRARVGATANAITDAHSTARHLARLNLTQPGRHFGVRISNVGGGAAPQVAVVTGGNGATKVYAEDGVAVHAVPINPNTVVFAHNNSTVQRPSTITWWYSNQTGYPVASPGSVQAKPIGLDVTGAQFRHFGVSAIDGAEVLDMAIYDIGASHVAAR